MQMKLLLINSDKERTGDDYYESYSVHIVTNKQATYICPLIIKATSNIYNEVFNLVSSHSFHFKANEKGYDTGDFDGFDFVLLTISNHD